MRVRQIAGIALYLGLANAQEASWRSPVNVLSRKGLVADQISTIWWFLFSTASLVFLVVITLLLIALFKKGQAVPKGPVQENSSVRPILYLGTGLTIIVLLITAVYTFISMRTLAAPSQKPALTFEIVGKQWWWDIRYEGESISANELHIPSGEPVHFSLHSDNVIHSFWLPDLAGKRDLIPGHPNSLWLQADEPGTYRGSCAEFCGVQHGKMNFTVIAEPRAAFETWLEHARAEANAAVSEEARVGQAIFMQQGCAGCHSIRGTAAQGEIGPELTHLSSRLTLAAANIPNTTGHLAAWIVDSQSIKPGNRMPSQKLSGEDLQFLLSYLMELN